jgi:hypothetical protein
MNLPYKSLCYGMLPTSDKGGGRIHPQEHGLIVHSPVQTLDFDISYTFGSPPPKKKNLKNKK